MADITDTQKLLSENLKAIRKEKGLNQNVVAERSGVIASTYSRIETCQVSPNLSTLEKLAEAMEVPMERLFKQDTHADKTLLEKLEMIKNMEEYNQQILEIMIDTVLEKDKLERTQKVKMKKRLSELDKIKH
ncbi:helix-turn-helix domain-containing protein [Psychroserpens sp. SPM9]|uniref:helix-turn-helix domain-containing protein n=1 Tax=Psychroserpens sp. SPM9 TaxID=2975598 RepID=UPI0021A644D5|nr:helix-turn-helix transcriptional regulator [Psychroserpens sp. SPM9]MDG5490596.1 helix-turn-helix transcriptional regulator [Psychroserpens sp. SPM9]